VRVLGLETSSRLAGVAIIEEGRILGEVAADTRASRTELLLLHTERLLRDLDLTPHDLSWLAVSAGPGSFTGLRVGIASAIGLAAGADRPIVEVPTLEVLAYPHRRLRETIVCVSGHRRRQLNLAAYRWEGERFAALRQPACIPEEDLLGVLDRLPGGRLHFVGDALDSLASAIGALPAGRALLLSSATPRAAHVALLALDPMRPRWTGKDLEGRSPSYLRDADARKPAQQDPSRLRRP
jgi:tRNA threonylcarbamoyladenosine biosynthesis protein TsaB